LPPALLIAATASRWTWALRTSQPSPAAIKSTRTISARRLNRTWFHQGRERGLGSTVTSVPLLNGHRPGGRGLDASHLGDIQSNESDRGRRGMDRQSDRRLEISPALSYLAG